MTEDEPRYCRPRKNPSLARLLHWLGAHDCRLLFRLLSTALGGDLPCRAYTDIVFPHPYGITIHEGVEVGAGSVIYQHVTIGTRDGGPNVPRLGRSVVVGAGAAVLGGVTVGDCAVIGANAVVVEDVPPHSTVYPPRSTIIQTAPRDIGDGCPR